MIGTFSVRGRLAPAAIALMALAVATSLSLETRAQDPDTGPLIVIPLNPSVAFTDSLAAALSREAYFGRLQAADLRLFLRIYLIDEPAFRRFVLLGDAGAYPLFYGAVPAATVSAVAFGTDGGAPYRLALSEAFAMIASDRVKALAERIRPARYSSRLVIAGQPGGRRRASESYSFPSGHAAVAAALVTSWSLSHPHWYVIGPGAVWVASVGLSRIWLGRHFPGDVAAGVLIGAAAGLLVDRLDRYLTPSILRGEEPTRRPSFSIRLSLP